MKVQAQVRRSTAVVNVSNAACGTAPWLPSLTRAGPRFFVGGRAYISSLNRTHSKRLPQRHQRSPAATRKLLIDPDLV